MKSIFGVRIIMIYSLLLSTVLLNPAVVSAQLSRHPLSEKWELIARADFIGKAKIFIPEFLDAQIKAKNYDYVNLQLKMERTVKGPLSQQPLQIRYHTRPSDDQPSVNFLNEYNGKDVIVFLVCVDQGPAAGVYFAANTPAAVVNGRFDCLVNVGIRPE